MQIHDVTDYYRPKRFPWLPVAIIAAAVIGAIVLIMRGDDGDAKTDETAESGAASAIQETTPEAASPATASSSAPAYTAPAGPAMSAGESASAIAEARKAKADGNPEAAREKLLAIVDRVNAVSRPAVEAEIGALSIELFTTPRPMKGKVEYVVKSGDSLSAIAARYECPVELIQKANGIKDRSKIRIGDRLVFPDHPKFSIVVSKSANTLSVMLDGRLFKKYSVGTGMHAKTPAGTFKVVDKISEPPWWPGDGQPAIPYGDKRNILGTRWLAIEATGETPRVRGYGIHGTWDDSTIGKQSSAGCVRMRNPDVEEVFMMMPRGTPVSIVE